MTDAYPAVLGTITSGARVIIDKPLLSYTGDDAILQRVATVYVGQHEFRVYAPARAYGDAMEWLEQLSFRQPDPECVGAEIDVAGPMMRKALLNAVKEKLAERQTPNHQGGGVAKLTGQLTTGHAPNRDAVPTDPIEQLCLRFRTIANQISKRHDNRSTLTINDEYDVQDLMHALLRVFFDDVRVEEWTPSYAGKSARMDFFLPTEETVLEIKKTRDGLETREIGDQLIVDIARYRKYPSCKRLICFVYDPDLRIKNPRGVERDLAENHEGFEVKVIIAPRG